MDRSYAAELNGSGRVTRVIVGSAEWATDNLGGVWIDSDDKVGAGWERYEGGLRPPAPFPSWSWDGMFWNAPVPAPEDGEYWWDENRGSWFSGDADDTGMVETG